MTFDPRTMGKPVYQALAELKKKTSKDETKKEQKNQAVELYTYLSTWGMMRLKAEEAALSQEGKKQVVIKYFEILAQLSDRPNITLDNLINLGVEEYLGLTGLGLELAQQFSFWATAVYSDVDQ